MKKVRLNEPLIDGHQKNPPETRLELWDTTYPGLVCRITPAGTVSYRLAFRLKGKLIRETLHPHKRAGSDKLSLASARAKARERENMHRTADGKGESLAEKEREARRKGLTMSDLCTRYRESDQGLFARKPTTRRDYEAFLHLLENRLGRLELRRITRADIESMLASLKRQKSKRTGGELSGARLNRVMAFTSHLFTFAMHREMTDKNPCTGIERHKERQRHRFATEAELTRILGALDGEENIFFRALFRLLMLTMCRLSEIAGLQWRQIDLDAAEIRLPDTKNGLPFTVHLCPEAVEVLRELPKIEGCQFVFPSSGAAGGHVWGGIPKAWRRICRRAGVEGLRIHDLRRSGASHLLMRGMDLQSVATMLNHSSLETTRRYARLSEGAKKHRMAKHGEFMAGLRATPTATAKAAGA